jgi:hypothetical protein
LCKRDFCLEDGGSRAVSNVGNHTLVLTSSGSGFLSRVSLIALTSGRSCCLIIVIIALILVHRFVQKLFGILVDWKEYGASVKYLFLHSLRFLKQGPETKL